MFPTFLAINLILLNVPKSPALRRHATVSGQRGATDSIYCIPRQTVDECLQAGERLSTL